MTAPANVTTARKVRLRRARRVGDAAKDPMTGDRVKAVRESYGLTPPQLAELAQTGLSSVYRWEELGASLVGLGAFQDNLLRVMERHAREARGLSKRGKLPYPSKLDPAFTRFTVEPATLHAAIAKGELHGLYALLCEVYGSKTEPT